MRKHAWMAVVVATLSAATLLPASPASAHNNMTWVGSDHAEISADHRTIWVCNSSGVSNVWADVKKPNSTQVYRYTDRTDNGICAKWSWSNWKLPSTSWRLCAIRNNDAGRICTSYRAV